MEFHSDLGSFIDSGDTLTKEDKISVNGEFSPEPLIDVETVKGFFFAWQPLAKVETVREDNFFELRPWQKDCFQELKEESKWIINAPMAAGKSFMISCLASHAIVNRNKKVVIAVPQTIIGQGFKSNFIHFSDNERYVFKPHKTLLDGEAQNVQEVLRFLSLPSMKENAVNDLTCVAVNVLVCTHATLVRVFTENPNAFKDCLVVIDEAHHICAHTNTGFDDLDNDSLDLLEDDLLENEGDEEEEEHKAISKQKKANTELENKLGKLLKHILKDPSVEVGLTTATPFRGDKLDMVPEKDRNLFKTFKYPFDLFLKSCEHLKGLTYDFMFAPKKDEGYNKPIRNEFARNPDKKTIIFIPHVSQIEDKHLFVSGLYQSITQAPDMASVVVEDKKEFCLVWSSHKPEKKYKVLNLVDIQNRSLKKDYVEKAHNHPTGERLDIIIALNMFQEGASWKWAERLFLLGSRNSLTQTIQMVGRLFRDAKGKESVEIKHVLPCEPCKPSNLEDSEKGLEQEDEFKEMLNDYMKAFFASLLLENIFMPVEIRIPQQNGTVKKIKSDFMSDLFGDKAIGLEYDLNEAWILGGVLECETTQEAIEKAKEVTLAFLQDEVDKGALDASVLTQVEEVVHCILARSERRVRQVSKDYLPIEGLSVSEIDLSLVERNPFRLSVEYTTGFVGLDTLESIRFAFGQKFTDYEEASSICIELGIKGKDDFKNRYKELGLDKERIPRTPNQVYKRTGEWKGWAEFLDTENHMKDWISYEEASSICIDLGIKSQSDFQNRYKELNLNSKNIPKTVEAYYKKTGEWISWGDFLNTGNRIGGWISYEEASSICISLGIKGGDDFRKRYDELDLGKHPIPKAPERPYKRTGDWKGWAEFLDTENHMKDWISYEEASEICIELGIKGKEDFQNRYKELNLKDRNIPRNPNQVYKRTGEWISWGDFLNTGNRKGGWIPYEEASSICIELGIKNQKDFKNRYKELNLRGENIPTNVEGVYKKTGEWISWGDFLNTGNRIGGWISYEEASSICISLGIKSQTDFKNRYKELNLNSKNIPKTPWKVYQRTEEWVSWSEFLNTGNKRGGWISYEEASYICIELGIKSREDFKNRYKELNLNSKNIPKDPYSAYKRTGEWISWHHFLNKSDNTEEQ